MQIHWFIEYIKASCLDLQFILSKIAIKARNIQKTIIFVNFVVEICLLINIIVSWMKKLGYLDYCSNWIKPYHSTMFDWDKNLITKAFFVSGDNNLHCIILVTTDVYGIRINNPDIKLIIQ